MPTSKRSWDEANPPPEADAIWVRSPPGSHSPRRNSDRHMHNGRGPPAADSALLNGRTDSIPQNTPLISRKVKACAACRKHKVKQPLSFPTNRHYDCC